jgi:hypothetical protein
MYSLHKLTKGTDNSEFLLPHIQLQNYLTDFDGLPSIGVCPKIIEKFNFRSYRSNAAYSPRRSN